MTFGLKHELLRRGKTQRGAMRDVTDAGTRLCPLYTHVDTHLLKLTGCGTGFVLSDVAVILLVQDNNSQEDESTLQEQFNKMHS